MLLVMINDKGAHQHESGAEATRQSCQPMIKHQRADDRRRQERKRAQDDPPTGKRVIVSKRFGCEDEFGAGAGRRSRGRHGVSGRTKGTNPKKGWCL